MAPAPHLDSTPRRPQDPLRRPLPRLDRKHHQQHVAAASHTEHRTVSEKRQRVGYEFTHSAIDDHSRLAYTELHADEKAATVLGFTQRAIALFAGHGITIQRWQTDNAWTYTHNNALAALFAEHGIRHRTIRPRTPRHNGKVERYQQTLKREWGLGQRYRSSDHRAAALPHWLQHYNHERNHSSLSNRPPITRVRNDLRQNS